MGSRCMRFGRNFPRKVTEKPSENELWTPNPRLLSERIMARQPGGFKPATSLNLLAAAWIQFQTHDWFFHETSDDSFDIPLPPGDDWQGGSMKLPRTKPDDILDTSDIRCPGYKNTLTAWWDASQIYGPTEEATRKLRGETPDGKLTLVPIEGGAGFVLPRDKFGDVETGFSNNWWTGIEMLHTLFAMEHNAICDKLRKSYPDWTGDQIFDKARLVNSALMAKIHTIEWTPAILAHPALRISMNANWWGLAGETLNKLVGRIAKNEAISGIPGSTVDHFGAPYSLTEEFVSVYRMHSLIPDQIAFFNSGSGEHQESVPTEDLTFTHARRPFEDGLSFADAFYSFGINYPGAITNKNYPNFLRDLTTPDGLHRDMGTVDILRDRERGVPRYNQFRRLLRMSVPKTFEELTGGDKVLAAELSELYNGDIELVDCLVGSQCEPLPEGFGFSDTAFRIFILMASRRLNSDRFIAGQWNEDTYTKEGLHWVQYTDMKDVIGRHFPGLRDVLKKSKNVFAPWEKLSESNNYTGVETNEPRK
ncbi:Peroxidase family protein [Lasiodiplodia theobromae]|uniref:Peroxidase family protein n=1 Tax=Lasiodiplodia theobromae TaxID=45133 RepID=UPI0015C31B24|nr:Peroxidase family protein [Lasiodiplodia theobromae]KAF4534017.1 Peroxidase family protein [Lasiodiplodia theobromae]